MLRHAVFALLLYTSYSLLDQNGDEDDEAVKYFSHNVSRSTRPEVNEELDKDVFPLIHNGCLYFAVESIKFDILDKGSFNSSWLMKEYDHYTFTVSGCHNSSKTIQSQLQCGDQPNETLFTFTAMFKKKQRPNECSEDTWSMVQLTHQNSTHNSTDSNHYVYNIDTVTAENDCYYHCSSVSFTSDNGDAKITLHNITIQAFSLADNKLSSRMVTCRKTYDYDYLTYIISSGMGISVILAIVVIIISCLAKRLKYGKYNLLDT